MDKRKKIKEKLVELESLMGGFSLQMLLQRVLYEIGRQDLAVPQNPLDLDLNALNDREFEQFVTDLADIVSSIMGEEFGKEIKKIWNG